MRSNLPAEFCRDIGTAQLAARLEDEGAVGDSVRLGLLYGDTTAGAGWGVGTSILRI